MAWHEIQARSGDHYHAAAAVSGTFLLPPQPRGDFNLDVGNVRDQGLVARFHGGTLSN